MRRLAIVPAGVLVAFLTGCCFLVTALLIESLATPAATSLALFDLAALLATGLANGDAGHLVGAGLTAIWLALLAVCFAPVGLVALLGEAARQRSLVWASGGTGIATAAVPMLLRAASDGPARLSGSPAETRATLILFLTGLAAGFAYWVVAGRSAVAAGTLR